MFQYVSVRQETGLATIDCSKRHQIYSIAVPLKWFVVKVMYVSIQPVVDASILLIFEILVTSFWVYEACNSDFKSSKRSFSEI